MEKALLRSLRLAFALWVLADCCLLGLYWTPVPARPFWLLAGLLVGLMGLLMCYQAQKTASLPPTEPDMGTPALQASESLAPVLPPDDSLPIAPPNSTSETLHRYMTQFLARYDGFYRYIQEIPVRPDAAQKQQIRRNLVEMGLHAHSLARAYKFDPTLQSLADEPNVTLILNGETVPSLPPSAYRTFTDDPQLFDPRYQFLREVLREMDLGQLDNVLAQKVYIAPTYLTPATAQ